MSLRSLPLALTVLLSAPRARGDERLKDIACRSVHLVYQAGEALAFHNEVTVEHSAPGTYFMVCGWKDGYFGLQELEGGRKQVIFSVWDSVKTDDPGAVAGQDRVQLLYQDPAVRVGRFGGEGTGGQSFLPFPWKAGATYRFLVTARPEGARTAFTGWVYQPETLAWRRLVTFSTLAGGRALQGCYSFVEDFQRDRTSTRHARRARYGNGWVRGRDGVWRLLDQARFTADRNPVLNIDAGAAQGRFFLATGGDTANTSTPLGGLAALPAEGRPTKPAGLPEEADPQP